MNTKPTTESANEYGVITRALAGFCHSCKVCPYAATKSNTAFERVMRWHRTWCPGWISHTKVYGEKPLPYPPTAQESIRRR